MKRTGILGLDALTEALVRDLFLADPDAQVFLSPGTGERAQRLSQEFPCWTLDDPQALVNEVDVLIISSDAASRPELYARVQLRRALNLVSLVPEVSSQALRKRFRQAE
jgi:pyrroline-5-carboxylate reductase